jgi:hypothetical protein
MADFKHLVTDFQVKVWLPSPQPDGRIPMIFSSSSLADLSSLNLTQVEMVPLLICIDSSLDRRCWYIDFTICVISDCNTCIVPVPAHNNFTRQQRTGKVSVAGY